MKRIQIIYISLLVCLTGFTGCESREELQAPALPEPGTAGHYYLLGLDTKDPQRKLELYNKGLAAVTSKKDTSLVVLLDGKIYSFLVLGYKDSLPVWIDSLITTAALQGDLYFQAKGYYRKSVYYANTNPEERFRNAYYSRNIHLRHGDTTMAGRRSLDMAHTQFTLGDFAGSQENAIDAIEYLDYESDIHYVASAYNVLGLSYAAQRLHDAALQEYEMALKFATAERDSLSYLHNIALLHKDQSNYDAAVEIFEKIVKSDAPPETSQLRFRDNYAYTRWLQDSTFNPEKIFLDVLEQRMEVGDFEGMGVSYSHLANYYEDINPAKSLEYSKKMLEFSSEISNLREQVIALEKLIFLSEGKEKDQFLEKYLFLSDSLRNTTLQSRYQFAKIKFDEERKEQQINLLQAQNLTQSLKAEQLRMGNIVSSLSALLILIISGASFYYLRQKNRRERIKQIYLTENRISRRIHDELANDIYHVMSSLETVAPLPMIDKLEKIYQRTRDFSRENSEIVTGEEYLHGLLNMLSGTVPPGTKLIIRGENNVDWEKLKSEKKIVLYRVLQEMMVNMKKHSQARLVALVFSSESKRLHVSYSDNGIGADSEKIENGNGIKNLVERLKTINGKAIFEPAENGVKAEFLIPFNS